MKKAFLSFCVILSSFFISFGAFSDQFQWSMEDYQPIYGDFDGDSRHDTFLISKSRDTQSRLYSDTMGSNNHSDFVFHFDPTTQHLLAGDFDHDGRDEFMVLDSELDGEYYLLTDDQQLVEGDEKLRIKGYNNNRRIDFTHLYRGDFNGDTVDDLLAYAEETHDIVVFHNKNKAKKIKFKFDAQLSLNNPEPLTLKIRDFNGDGMQDIVLLSDSPAGASFVAFAGKKGRFKRSDFEDITLYLNGEDFSTGQHSVYLWADGANDDQMVVRLPNASGGVDEEGNPVVGDGADSEILDSATTKPTQRKSTQRNFVRDSQQGDTGCQHLAYSPLRKVLENTCLTQNHDSVAANAKNAANKDSSKQSKTLLVSSGQPGIAATISAPAEVNASVPHGGDDVTISWSAVSGVSQYNREVSINGGGWQNTKTYPYDQTSVVFSNQQSRSYRYRVRACNNTGCSGWRVSNSVTVNPTPALPSTPSSAPTVYGGSYHSNNVSQISVGLGSVSGATFYKLYVGTSSSNVSLKSSSSSTVQNFQPNIQYGYLYIKYKACTSAGCSGYSPWKRIYIYAAPGTPGSAVLDRSAINVGGSAVLSWSRPGGMIPGGEYHIREVTPGGATTVIANVQESSQSSYSYTVRPGSNTAGTWQYRVNACNPGVGCGGSRSASLTLLNRHPIATNKSTSVNEGASVSINVLQGASDPDGHALSVSHASQPNYGSVSCSGSQCTYTANHNIGSSVTDNFTYTVVDGFGGSASANVSVNIKSTAATPVISPTGGIFTDSQTVTISSTTSGATIYYTINGTTPGTSSPVYGGPLTLTGSTTLKAIAVKSSHNNSGVRSASFTKATTPDWAETGGTAPVDSTQSASTITSTFNGSTPGEAGVSGGAAVYNIPIVIPPGRNGVQPDVSLNFSSRSGAGIAGVGWSLSAGSSISRCPRTIAQDGKIGGIRYDLNDRLCLDGQRLVPITGNYGVNGTTYTTEMESFIKVTQNGRNLNQSGVSFTVDLPDGSTRKYGSAASSRIVATHKTQALSWLITKHTDVTGNNTMAYHYTTDKSDGEILLNKITYTGTATGVGNREVRFFYQNDAKFSSSYLAGGLTRSTQRLNYIDTFYGSSRIRRYDLSYKTSAASGRSLLTNVKECGYVNNAASQCRTLTSFTWQDAAPTIKQEVMMAGSTEAFPGVSGTNLFGNAYEIPKDVSKGALSFDVDGNGVRDWNNNGTVYHINAEGALKQTTTNSVPGTCNRGRWTHQLICVEADYDINGLMDGFSTASNILQIHFSNADAAPTVVSTGINMREAYVVNAGDYNGDGYPDIVTHHGAGEYRLHFYNPDHDGTASNGNLFITRSNALFYATTNHSAGVPSKLRDAQFVGDMNGDGLGDFAVSGQIQVQGNQAQGFAQPSLLSLKLSNMNSNGDVSFSTHNLFFAGSEPDSEPDPWVQETHNYSALVDVNGDGLKDWLGYLVTSEGLHYRLNKGDGSFGSRESLGLTLPNRQVTAPLVDPLVDRFTLEPMFMANFAQVDIDGDGKPELLMPDPDKIVAEACTFTNELHQNGQGTYDIWRCGSDIEKPVRRGQLHQYINLNADINRTVYEYQAVKFTEGTDGKITAEFIETDYQGTPADVANVDAYGNGLQDMLFGYGCNYDRCRMQTTSSTTYSGKAGTVFVNRNYGAGKGTSGSDYMPLDMMTSVSNGVGMVSNWDYRPLSSDKYSDSTEHGTDAYNDGAFYDPVRESFEDGEHFNFASSMYVVGSFKQTNGAGGQNETRYQYSGAVYNSKGRGFRGFKTITQRDVANNTTTHTRFRQKFPYSSAVDVQTVMEGKSALLGSLSDAAVTPALLPDSAVTSHILSQSLTFHDENPQYTGPGKLLYQPDSVVYQYDPTGHAQLSKTLTTVSSTDIDKYGNVEESTTLLSDEYGEYTTINLGDFGPAVDDWPRRYASKSVIKKKVENRSGLTLSSGQSSLDRDKVVKTTVTWDTDVRKPERVTVKYGEAASITASNANTSASNTATITTSHYNDYGLPTGVVVQGSGITGTNDAGQTQYRAVFTRYSNTGTATSATGYFPFEIKQRVNVNGSADAVSSAWTSLNDTYLTTETRTDPKTGLPVKVTDVSGVVTTTTYDSLARPTAISRSGYPTQYLGYRTPDSVAPGHAVMFIRTVQAGVPESREYKDVLGRTLRTATRHFNGTNFIKQDVVYNARGLVTLESAPSLTSRVTQATYSNFDVLGRPGGKVTKTSNGQLSTTYTYNGLTTDISVTPTNGHTLNMSRTYNSLEQLLETVDAIDGDTQYAYDGSGNPVIIADAAGHQIVARYDALGRKTYVDDPNMGRTDFRYNDFGELEREKDAAHHYIRYDMDLLGRVTRRYATSDGTATFTWDTHKAGLLTRQEGNGAKTTYAYDSAGRVTNTTVNINGRNYVTTTLYDGKLGRPKAMQYPAQTVGGARLTVEYDYNPTGYLTHERNAANDFVYREITAQDALGNITTAKLNNATLTGTYRHHHISGQMLSTQAGTFHNISYENGTAKGYDSYGNLKYQRNAWSGASESYTYDALHRLTRSAVTYAGGEKTIDYGYDAVGNFNKKTDFSANSNSAYSYSAGTNRVSSVALKGGGSVSFGYDARGNQTHRNNRQEQWYNAFNKPTRITKNSQNITLTYGPDIMRYKQVRIVDGETITTWYIGKHFEVEQRAAFTNTRHFISDVAIVDLYNNRVPQIAFTHKDRLGSTVTMTDHNNTLTSMRHFDAFGKPRGGNWALLDPPQFPSNLSDNRTDIRRGFTDHEHLDEAELIHMNGRVYDYNVGRFMSVDPVIQSPTNTQSINPYSYIMNNPMAGTDPTGYEAVCDDKKCHEQERKVEEPEKGEKGGQTNNGVDNYQGENGNSTQTPVYATESKTNQKQKEPEKKEESTSEKIERIVTTCDKKCQNEAKLQERIVEYTKKALREQQTRWVRGPTGHMQTQQGAVHELIYGPNSQLTDNQCGTFTAMVCAASIFLGGEIPEELSSFRDELLDGADKATDTADKLKDSLGVKDLKKIPLNKPAKLVKDSLSLGKAWQICKAACDAKNKALN